MDSALRKAKDSIGQIFDKNLQDLVRGIRSHKENEAKYISECIDEIKNELKLDNLAIKSNAISKLCYLQMLGYDISWASFNIIEVMSSPKFTHKRIGYLAASQSFHDNTDVLMLTTNMIRKDLNSQHAHESSIALSGLACFMNTDLARDLANEIMTLMTSNKPHIRKKAVLIMYKIFLKYPDALRPSFQRLKEKLEDPDPGVQAAAVNVICELARRNPKNYLSLAPVFFKLMNSSTNNWVLIKIIKLFGALTPLEPRLGKKLIEPLTALINSTSAMSLLYECINTVVAVLISISSELPNHNASIQLCVQKLRVLIEDSDQNLKYLGLLAMSKILQTNPKSVLTHKDLIMQCLDDKDESIRLRALNLLYGMVSKKSLMEIIRNLMTHMNKAEGSHYRDQLLTKIIDICSQNNYQYVTNFEWYVSVLVELTRTQGTKHGKLIASQLIDVAVRVESIRQFTVSQMAILINNMHLFTPNNSEVLYAAIWICGEFCDHLAKAQETLDSMLKSKVNYFNGQIQACFVQNVSKIYSLLMKNLIEENDFEQAKALTKSLSEKLIPYEQSGDLEVQERSCVLIQILKYVTKQLDKNDQTVVNELSCLFDGDLNPVASKAQRKVPVPEGLDLDKWINEPPSESEDEKPIENQFFLKENSQSKFSVPSEASSVKSIELTEEERKKRLESRKIMNEFNPYYIKTDAAKKPDSKSTLLLQQSNSNQELKKSEQIKRMSLDIPGIPSSDSFYKMSKIDVENSKLKKKMKKKSSKKGKNQDNEAEDDDDEMQTNFKIMQNEMPDGANDSGNEADKNRDPNDPHKALDINLDEPLRDNERLSKPAHRVIQPIIADSKQVSTDEPKTKAKKKTKESKKSKKNGEKEILQEENSISGYNELLSPEDNGLKVMPQSTSQNENISQWLEKNEPANVDDPDKENIKSQKKKKEKKEKRDKDEKKNKKSSKNDVQEPSKEVPIELPSNGHNGHSIVEEKIQIIKPNYTNLASSNHINMSYKTIPDQMSMSHIIVDIKLEVVKSNDEKCQISQIELNILDTLNTRIVKDIKIDSNGTIRAPFTLDSVLNTENEIRIIFSVDDCTFPQKLKGSLAYMIKTELSPMAQEKIDFKLNLPCSSYLVNRKCDSSQFNQLLTSGELNGKHSIKFKISDFNEKYKNFRNIIHKLCLYLNFNVVEIVDNCASLFTNSMKNHPVCILVKLLSDESLAIDGKSSNSNLIYNIIEECKSIIQQNN